MKETVGNETNVSAPLRQALTATGLADRDLDVEAVSLGNRKDTYLVRPAGGQTVVVQTSDDASSLQTEATLLKRISAETSVPVPAVVASGLIDGRGYLVTRHVDGENLHYQFANLGPEPRRSLAAAFGRHLATLHETVQFEAFGTVSHADGCLQIAGEQGWESWFAAYANAALERLPDDFDGVRDALEGAVAGHEGTADPTPCLFPWDYRPGNAVVQDGTLAAILDWEEPMAADPALSVAKAEYLVADWYVEETEPLREAFREGYRSVRPFPQVEPAHQIAAIASSTVDSRGVVTNPRYPELDRESSVEFHLTALRSALHHD